ncbi:hypothetical protein [Pedobacter sp.]|uniref:hypothetical protein n=1 Tax=Pedobacter sp. TaxID=1411316 RepID=UPI0031DFFF5D
MGLRQKIVLVTSGQPSLNPRLVKEADALANAGYEVVVIYQYWNDWGTDLDIELLKTKRWTAYRVGGSPNEHKLTYWYARIQHKLASYLLKHLGPKGFLVEAAIGRCCLLLAKKAQAIKADLYIGHNLAALPAIVKAARYHKGKCGFDAEDFHRYEESDDENELKVKLKIAMEDRYIHQLDYLTTASPLIDHAYRAIYPLKNGTSILNVFGQQATDGSLKKENAALKLFWFSQTIGTNRGLEQVIEAMSLCKQYPIELHLLGACRAATKSYFNNTADRYGLQAKLIFYHPPIPEKEIFTFAQQFDIGLATETSLPKNRDICLTNKIFTYVQIGLATIASNTTAQRQLMEKYPDMGSIFESTATLVKLLENYASDKKWLKTQQKKALLYARTELNWEKEQEKFLSIIRQTI